MYNKIDIFLTNPQRYKGKLVPAGNKQIKENNERHFTSQNITLGPYIFLKWNYDREKFVGFKMLFPCRGLSTLKAYFLNIIHKRKCLITTF